MLINYLKASLFLIVILFFVSCEKDTTCIDLKDECRQSCAIIPDLYVDCPTGASTKYYFNPSTEQCEAYIYAGGDIPFETLQECESCGCNAADN